MNLRRYLLRALALVAGGLLVSCIDGREEFWLEADGSGRADVCYSLPASAAALHGGEAGVRQMIGDFLKTTPGIATSSHEVATADGRLKILVRASFGSALDFHGIFVGDSASKLPNAVSNLAGNVKVSVRGLSVDFSRTLTPGKALPGSIFMPASRFEGRRLSYIVHLPAAATESNATRVADAGRTLIWDFPLAEAVKSPLTTRFKAPLPIPPWQLATACAIVLSIGFFGIRKLRTAKQTER